MGGVIGLDYVAVNAAINMAGITIKSDTFDGLRIMESVVIEVMNKNV